MDSFCGFFYVYSLSVIMSGLFLSAFWSTAGKSADQLSLLYVMLSCVYHFPIWCPGSDVVLDCIVSRPLPSSLLCILFKSASPNICESASS